MRVSMLLASRGAIVRRVNRGGQSETIGGETHDCAGGTNRSPMIAFRLQCS